MSFFLFLSWLLLVWALGWLFLPISRRIFSKVLPDEGLAVGRILALGFWTMAAFWVARVGVPIAVCAWFFLPMSALGLWLWKREQSELSVVLKTKKRARWSSEAVFLLVFLLGFGLRGFWSDTNGSNGEKGMDSALVAALSRAKELPATNPYAAGALFKSYYYFGHLETALLTRATGTTVRWSYNLMCATLPALCASALFSLGAALTRRLWGGAFVCFAVLFLGTLSPLYQWSHSDLYAPSRFLRLDFFAVSRVIPFSINEFPFFTFNQADLHAHYFNFQFQIAAMCVAFALFCLPRRATLGAAALVLGAIICTNTWDFLAYFLLIALAIGAAKGWGRARKTRALALVLAGSMFLAAPFLLGLKSAAGGPKLLSLPASPLREWLLMWGVFVVAWALFTAKTLGAKQPLVKWAIALAAVFVGIGAAVADWGYPAAILQKRDELALALAAWKSPTNPAWLVWAVLLFCAGSAGAVARKMTGTPRFLGLLSIAGLFALIFAESSWSGFLGDANYPFADDFKRQDTVFKFGLQTWMLWGTACAAASFLFFPVWPKTFRLLIFPFLAVMAISSIAVVYGRTRGFEKWDGWDAWAHLAPPEKDAAHWLEVNTPPGAAILEAEPKAGGDYSASPRFTHATGIATIIGPQAHTFQWAPANSGDAGLEWANVFERKREARAIYEDQAARPQLLQKYGVKYIIWGELERGTLQNPEYTANAEISLRSDPNLKLAARFGWQEDPHRVEIFEVHTP